MDSVVVGLDGSPDSRAALRWAAEVAAALQLPLRVLEAWQYPSDAILSIGRIELPHPDRAEEQLAAELERLVADELGSEAAPVSVEVAPGPAVGVLLHAASRATRMVVVGSRGLGGFRGLLLGSVSRQLAEHAPCPVTIVRPNTEVDPVRLHTIVVGLDGSAHAERALGFAAELAGQIGANLVLANVVAPGAGDDHLLREPGADLRVRRELVQQWGASLREAGIEHRVAVVTGDARTALLAIARDHQADLLIVGSRGLGPVAKLLIGSVASSLIQHGDLPVTVVPHPR